MMAVGRMRQVAEYGAKEFCPCWATAAVVALVTDFFGFHSYFFFYCFLLLVL